MRGFLCVLHGPGQHRWTEGESLRPGLLQGHRRQAGAEWGSASGAATAPGG